ncbi:competence/damage-inducible protein A [Halocola ammonii]
MQAEVITIGDEILIGQTVDTNSAWIAEQLNLIGVSIYQITSISDTREHILEALETASKRSNLVILTGGLGPTRDDITKVTLCEFFDTELEMNEDVLARITDYFERRKKKMLDSNVQQAMLPKSAQTILNVRGTASGMWFEKDGTVFISMPGVPYEMKGLMKDELLNKIAQHFDRPAIYHKTILTLGIGESFLVEKVKDWENSLDEANVKIAYLPSPGRVKVRLSAYGDRIEDLEKRVEAKASEFENLAAEWIYGTNGDLLEEVVGELLRDSKSTLAAAESCTGGMVSHMITSVSGSSDYFLGSIVSYANEVKTGQLGVSEQSLKDHGAVSQPVVEQMALGVRKALGADYGVATSGIAGPSGGTPEKPVGTIWIAVASPQSVVSKCLHLGNSRSRNIEVTAYQVLDLLRKELLVAERKH